MIEIFVKRPATTIIFIAIFMVMGLVSIGNLIIEPTPKIEFPIITIQTTYGGASPEEIETQVLKRVEDAVSEISQIKKISSEARDSYGVVIIEFLIEADVNIKSIEVKDKVEAIMNDFPSGADRPIIAKFDPLIKPIATLALMSDKHNLTELFEYADKKLKTRLSAINGVATVDVFGGRERQINVELDNNLMIQNYLSIEDVINSVSSKNLNVPGGSINRKDSKVSVRFVGEFESVEEIKNLSIVSREGRTIKLSSVGTVSDSYKDVDSIARFNGKDTVGIAVKKLSDGDAVKIVGTLKSDLEVIKKELPEGMKLEIAVDTTRVTVDNTVGTINSILLGVVLTIIILLVFLGDWRGAIIAAVVIPTSIISTFFIMDMSDFSINMMTLLAFGTCLGTLIANALIIIESIYKHLQMGKDPQLASIDGTKEVLLAIFASSGTNLVVFTPLAFMGGIVGQFMVQFGMTVVYATIFSIMASVTLTPMLCSILLKDPSRLKGPFPFIAKITDRVIAWITTQYKWFFDKMMDWPITATILSLAVFFTIVVPAGQLGSEFVPKSDRDEYTVTVVMPDGTPVEKTGEVVAKIDVLLKEYPEVTSTLSDIGYDGEEKARVTVSLTPAESREKSYDVLMAELLIDLAKIPEAEVTLSGGDSGSGGQGDITIDVTGRNFEEMAKASEKMKEIMANSGYFGSIESSYRIPKMEVQFNPDASKIIRQGLSNVQIGQVIRGLVNGNDDSVYKEEGEEYDINITLGDDFKKNVEDFDSFLIHGKDGLIPIASLGKVEFTEATSPLKRRDKKSIIQLNGYLAKSNTGTVMGELTKKFSELDLPESVEYAYTGNAENQAESSQELGKAFMLAVILTYMLLVAVLDSFVFPISIGSAILTSFLGSFALMFYTDQTVNIGSMMAMVMVVGLAVNNAILMIEYAQQKIAEGIEVREAIWLGAKEKLKPILMTSIAIIAGTLPQLFALDKIKSAMGAVIIGGMIGSIIFTYFLVPIVHYLVYKVKNLIAKFRNKEVIS
ncbi:putative transmembrane Acr-type transport protein [Halobacteriovorax marinus SJ]|uniref:Transmembrane Acr-type transport protein n=1 Tax=Halobacteriovorax marinus (strain ATCC BAA-682 / DSM 15412 / SJ) TaxID=862908 RepID=E1WY57_HALMS|nr:efflux RND transporter permease subunit [Halobacteriovorax marinus]CBW27612.1 putative transmembrane Acr-type transport protein [Halobacteriovorax marinus SJ]